MSDTRAIVIETINEVCAPERPDLSNPDRPLLGADLDSLDFASLLMAIEDRFGIVIGGEHIEKVGTLNKLVAYVDQQRAGGGNG